MKKILIYALLALLAPASAMADEGMWLVNLFESSIYPQMKKKGLKLKPGEIYNERGTALSGAIVAVDYGMGTGSVISDRGLVITNHHVAYGDIHDLSTPENNYLENGFWAATEQDELPVKGKTVMFLRRIADVTDEAMEMRDSMIREGKFGVFGTRKIYGAIEKKYGKDTPYEVSCASMWRGEKYLLFYYEVYKDVRLVGAPPEKIGAFGGNQDNWGWPQHKGDFALYRVYGDKDGKPAPYSKDNVPIKPAKVLDISTGGVHEGDYTMVLGFPGRTNRYMSSFAVAEKQQVVNPVVIRARHERMEIIKKHMEADPKVRLLYSDKYFNLSNYADYATWENICLRRYDVAGIREAEETELQRWIAETPERQTEYGRVLADLKKGYAARAEAVRRKNYFQEAWISPSDALMTGFRVASMVNRMRKEKIDSVRVTDKAFAYALNLTKKMYAAYDPATDQEIFAAMLKLFTDNVPPQMWGDYLQQVYTRYDGNAEAIADYAFRNSACATLEKLCEYFETPRTADQIMQDPLVALAASVSTMTFSDGVRNAEEEAETDVDKTESLYAKALYRMRESKGLPQYPDANSTMRITFGNVESISPYDAVKYDFRTTVDGYLEKNDPKDFEFRVDDKMFSLIRAKDWGRWGEKGVLYTDFITNNDITGGNSGSPVLNGRGNLVGLAFDGNRESMSGNIYFHPEYARTVCVDIRFVLWIIDRYAGASGLIEEMRLMK